MAIVAAVATATFAAVSSAVTCSTTGACVTGTNTSSGAGVAGTSSKGYGVTGTSSHYRGVEGTSTTANGVGGVTTSGTAGVSGQNASTVGYGVEGTNTATSGTPFGVFGQASVEAYSSAGVLGTGRSGVVGLGNTTASDFENPEQYAAGVTGFARGDTLGVFAEADEDAFEAQNLQNGGYADLAVPDYAMVVGTAQDYGVASIDYSGNEYLQGNLTTASGTYVRKHGASGTDVLAYSAQTTMPQLEDVGEGRLVNGVGNVAIDGQLGDVIDRRTAYHVFITPEGDCNQLYVAQKTPSGFTVRESHGGRSTVTFEYRIVAKPSGDNGRRLPVAPARPKAKGPSQRAFQAR